MNRQSFNPWLVDLGAGDFACALAAEGVLEHAGWAKASHGADAAILDRLLEIAREATGAIVCKPRVPSDEHGAEGPARGADLAGAWRKFAAQTGDIRLEVSTDDRRLDPLWIIRELSRPDVGARSIYLAKERNSPNERWHWPLRVGLLDDPASNDLQSAFKRAIQRASWARQLLTVSTFAGAGARADLLLVPHALRDALSKVLALPPGSRASSVVLTRGVSAGAGTRKLIETLDDQLQANAIALVTIAPQVVAEWFIESLLRQLSHDAPFDVAVADSLGARGDRPFHLLLANRDWLDAARLSHVTATLMQTMARPEVRHEEVNVGAELGARVGLPEGVHKVPALQAGSAGYLSERADATTLAELTNTVAPTLRRRPPAPEPRYLQAQVFLAPAAGANARTASAGEQAPAAQVTSFRQNSLHRVDVRVGVPEEQWISAPEVFAEEKLPVSKSGHQLTVVFSEPHYVPHPQVSHVFLPPAGSSSTCSFYLRIGGETGRVQARVVVLYRNRVLQTSMLDGPIVAGEPSSTDRITFSMETVVSPGLADLDRQASYGAALVINHADDGTPQVLKLVDDDAELVSTGNLLPLAQEIQDKLRTCDWASKDFRDIGGKGTLQLLRFLAARGSMLYKGIVKRQFIDDRLARAHSIQLIAAKPDVRLPVEYFYDRPSPDADARLCPSAKKAIARAPDKDDADAGPRDACSKECAARRESSRYICPLGFWGLTRVLEWHLYRPQSATELKSRDYAFQQEKLATRKQLPALNRAIVAASDRARAEVKTSVTDLVSAMKKNAIKTTLVRTWPEWKKEVETRRPPLLVLIPHIDVEQSLNVRQLEIGTGNWLRVDQPEKGFPDTKGCPPVVLLLGCESGVQDVVFEDFVSALAGEYAAVVVTSSAVILGRQATLLAGEFASVLGNLRAKKNTTFGEAMLAVRRGMLRKGYPMVLSVSAYGDADWRL